MVLVTGANNPYGIGAATARAFAAQGARVFLHFFRSSPTHAEPEPMRGPGSAFFNAQQRKTADEVLRTIHQSGGTAAAWEADLSDPANIPQLFDQKVSFEEASCRSTVTDHSRPSSLRRRGPLCNDGHVHQRPSFGRGPHRARRCHQDNKCSSCYPTGKGRL